MQLSIYGLIMNLFDGNTYIGPMPRVIVVNGVAINIDVWAAENGVTLPDSGN